MLRSHYIAEIFRLLSHAKEAILISAMNAKLYSLNGSHDSLMRTKFSRKTMIGIARGYLGKLRGGTGLANSVRLDHTPDRYSQTRELLSNGAEG